MLRFPHEAKDGGAGEGDGVLVGPAARIGWVAEEGRIRRTECGGSQEERAFTKPKRALERVQRQGNVIAHLPSHDDRHLLLPLEERLRSPVWVTRQQALEDLRDTAGIFKSLADSMASDEGESSSSR